MKNLAQSMETQQLMNSQQNQNVDDSSSFGFCKGLIISTFLLLIIAISATIFILNNNSSSTSNICSCSQPDAITLNSYSCVIPISDGLIATNIAGGLFRTWNITDYINITDIDGEPWIIYNDEIDDYEWRYPNEWFSYLLLTQNDTTGNLLKILIDASVGTVRPSVSLISSPAIYDRLVSQNCHDIDIVISTHFHQDHTGWFTKWENLTNITENNIIPTFPNAKYYSSKTEYDFWNSTSISNKSWLRFNERIVPIFQSKQLVLMEEGNYNLTKYISIRNCSGHTPGHSCIIWNDYEDENYQQKYIFFGDLMNRVVQISKPELNGWPDIDINGAIERRKEMSTYMYENDMIAFPAHFGGAINPGKVVLCDHCNSVNNFTWMAVAI